VAAGEAGGFSAQLAEAPIALRLTIVMVLVAANAFMVAAEFALVGTRRSKIAQMAAEGDRSAAIVQRSLKDLDRYISATQLGITLASLGLGWVGEPAVASMVDGFLGLLGFHAGDVVVHSTSAVITAFLIITFLHIVLGELAPKSVALVMPENVSKVIIRPLIFFSRVMSPFIWALNGTANAILRIFKIEPASESQHVHSAEELRLILSQAGAHGTLDESDSAMLAGVFDFHEKRARDVMRPRTDMIAIPIDATQDEVWEILRRERYSRYPVYDETVDDILGVFVAKDLMLRERDEPFILRDLLREPLYVPDSRPAERVLDDLRKTRAHMAIVLDEYGGTAGILTIEDLVEEVIGDIADEYDMRERTSLEMDGVLELAGSLSLVDVRSDHRLPIPEGDWSTLGGYAFSALGRLPKVGDRVPFPGGELEVVAMDGRRVAALRVHRRAKAAAER
jgi:CBS domain containing-hemolysin-like protein